jgi:hypothetical protein
MLVRGKSKWVRSQENAKSWFVQWLPDLGMPQDTAAEFEIVKICRNFHGSSGFIW